MTLQERAAKIASLKASKISNVREQIDPAVAALVAQGWSMEDAAKFVAAPTSAAAQRLQSYYMGR